MMMLTVLTMPMIAPTMVLDAGTLSAVKPTHQTSNLIYLFHSVYFKTNNFDNSSNETDAS